MVVFSLIGLSKSLVYSLRRTRAPAVYAVHDDWLAEGVRLDPWLRYWNAPSLPFMEQSGRSALELSGERGRLDDTAPTRLTKGYDRLPGLYGDAKAQAAVAPNSLPGFPLDRLYFCSQWLKEHTERRGFCVSHSEVIYPAIGSAFVGEVKPASAPVRRFLIVSQLTEKSGVLTALKALELARAAKVNATLHVCGRGESAFVATARSFAVSRQLPVEFITLSNLAADLPAIYKRHDALIHPPEWDEPFPVNALEAMACGLPVIGASSGGAGELLRHGENAFTFPPGDAAQLAAQMSQLQLSPALRRQMAETAQDEVLARFNETTVMDQVEDFLSASQGSLE